MNRLSGLSLNSTRIKRRGGRPYTYKRERWCADAYIRTSNERLRNEVAFLQRRDAFETMLHVLLHIVERGRNVAVKDARKSTPMSPSPVTQPYGGELTVARPERMSEERIAAQINKLTILWLILCGMTK